MQDVDSTDGGGSGPRVFDLVSETLAASTGQGARYHRTWEEELGDNAEARAAAAAWREWGIERPGMLLRREWFGGAHAHLFDWMSPPDPALRIRYGFTYDEVAAWVWYGFKFTDDEHIDEWRRVGLNPEQAAQLLGVARRTAAGRLFDARVQADTVQCFRDLGLAFDARKVWALQEAAPAEIVPVYNEHLGPLWLDLRIHGRFVGNRRYRKFGLWIALRRLSRGRTKNSFFNRDG